ncbi:U-Asilidin(1)-Mar1a-like [Leptopilina boulardi]|uniref:U-Asilidin(1)-Mar1a-like n=1 Tax=Leptopilina boulardi TaxID=63433 RepID=UPI0021F6169D|nr:U-Asilidin(1)-Mar1a-like [Leptopilina boulardi]
MFKFVRIFVIFCLIYLSAEIANALLCRPEGIVCHVPNQCCSYECLNGKCTKPIE